MASTTFGACTASVPRPRLVTWQTAKGREKFFFLGGIILVANCPLDDIPQLRAVKGRLDPLEFRVTNAEMAAFMRHVAKDGHRHGPDWLPPEECLEVAEEIIVRSQRVERPLDMRLLVKGFKAKLQWLRGASETHWTVLLESRMKERVVPARHQGVRAAERERKLALVSRIYHLPRPERAAIWTKETGQSEQAYYLWRGQMQAEDSSIQANAAACS
jgi:hypothetical protein